MNIQWETITVRRVTFFFVPAKKSLQGKYVDGSYVNGNKQPILNKFDSDQPLGYQIIETAIYRLYEKVSRSFLSRIPISFEEIKESVCASEGEIELIT